MLESLLTIYVIEIFLVSSLVHNAVTYFMFAKVQLRLEILSFQQRKDDGLCEQSCKLVHRIRIEFVCLFVPTFISIVEVYQTFKCLLILSQCYRHR